MKLTDAQQVVVGIEKLSELRQRCLDTIRLQRDAEKRLKYATNQDRWAIMSNPTLQGAVFLTDGDLWRIKAISIQHDVLISWIEGWEGWYNARQVNAGIKRLLAYFSRLAIQQSE